MTDRVSSSDSSWSESEEYSDEIYSPTKDQLNLALEELRDHHVTEIEKIGEGGYGCVYKGKYNGSYVVIKVSLYEYTKKVLKQTPKIRKLLLTNLLQRNSRKSSAILRHQKNEQQFFTEDHVLHSEKHPELIYHIMEYLPGNDLQVFFETDGKKLKIDPSRLTFDDLLKIFCSLLHAMKFFHDSGIVFNDLKLENVLVDPKYKRVTIIDYIDSSSGCSKLSCTCPDSMNIVQTFRDRHNEAVCIAEDILRIAMTMLDSIHLLTTGEMVNMPANSIQELITPYSYPMDKITVIVNNEINALKERFNLKEEKIKELRETLLDMLEENPNTRPDINELLERPPFNVCVENRSYLMPKMLDSRRLAKHIAIELGKEMGETPVRLDAELSSTPTRPSQTSLQTKLPARGLKRTLSSHTQKRQTPLHATKRKTKRKRTTSSKRVRSARTKQKSSLPHATKHKRTTGSKRCVCSARKRVKHVQRSGH